MAFITGLFLIDTPASALNNGEGEDTKSKVKRIYVPGQGDFPYVSAQAYRFWLRTSLEAQFDGWKASPVYTAGAGKRQQAYTEGDPIQYWDDDLLGYMRAEKKETVTRVSPLRNSTLVSIAPVRLVDDFGVMARFEREDDKAGVLLHGHEFYRATLQGLFSLDLAAAGTFTDRNRTGFKNLGDATKEAAAQLDLEYIEHDKAYRLPIDERIRRVQTLLRGMGRIEGGAKQTLHYTDVTPDFVIAAVCRGGNHIFGHLVKADSTGQPTINPVALEEVLRVYQSDLLSGIYVGRTAGFMDDSADLFKQFNLQVDHPREALDALAVDLANNLQWMD